MNKGVEIKVFGQVQGVFFRQGIKEAAEEFNLTGWVKNEDDGAVKIVAEGREENLQKLIEWCKRGSDWSRVESVETQWHEVGGDLNKFEIRY